MSRDVSPLLVVGSGTLAETLAAGLAEHPGLGGCRRIDPSQKPTAVARGFAADTVVLIPRRGEARDDAALLECIHRLASSTRRWVLLSSAMTFEPSHRHRGFLSEDDLPARAPRNTVARRWRGLEAAVREAVDRMAPGDAGEPVTQAPRLVILRPTPILLAGSGDPVTRLFAGRCSLTPAGYDPPLQLLSPDELIRALVETIENPPPGNAVPVLHIAPLGVVPLHRALAEAGVLRLPVPTMLLRLVRRLVGRPADEVEYLRYSSTVSDARRRSRHGTSSPPLFPRPDDDPAVAHDPFGLDRDYIRRLGRTFFRFLHDFWWRIEWRGLERIPRRGGAVLVGNHRGHQPWDGVMILHRIVRETGRFPRFLLHPTLVKFPYLAPFMIRCGGLQACRENGDWVLGQGEILAIFPEGVRGAFSRYATAHQLKRFRKDYVRLALRHGVPIVPLVVLGSAEIFPIVGKLDWAWWKRWSEWPTLPVTPTASLVPLPSKWHVQVLEPIELAAEHGPEAADDPATVAAIDRRARRQIAQTLEAMVGRRRSIFHGSIFTDESEPNPE